MKRLLLQLGIVLLAFGGVFGSAIPLDAQTPGNPYHCEPKPTLKKPANGHCVKNLQWYLQTAGNKPWYKEVQVNGSFDNTTLNAVIMYQLDANHRGLKNQPLPQVVTNLGTVEKNTWCAFYRQHGRSCSSLTGNNGGADNNAQTAQDYAKLILNHSPKIKIEADTIGIVRKVAAGQCAPVADTGACVAMSATLMRLIYDMGQETAVTIGELTGGHHVAGSFHHRGKAIDIANWQNHSAIMNWAYNHRYAYGINELIYRDSPLNLNNGVPYQYSQATINQHRYHIHLAVN